ISVVRDQYGCPTYAPHLARALLAVAQRVLEVPAANMWGLFHAAGTGEASRYELAAEVCRVSRALGGPAAEVAAITTAEYPTPAPRPANARLDCTKLAYTFGVSLPHWAIGVQDCVRR